MVIFIEENGGMRPKIEISVGIVLLFGLGWGLGHLQFRTMSPPLPQPARAEIAILSIDSLAGDELKFEVFGPVRLVWGEDKMLEGEGWQRLPLGQLADEVDLQFKQFAYTANAKTGKFYPSDSYPARGTAVRDRRFFQTKSAAQAAGFTPTKLVK